MIVCDFPWNLETVPILTASFKLNKLPTEVTDFSSHNILLRSGALLMPHVLGGLVLHEQLRPVAFTKDLLLVETKLHWN